MLGDILCSSDRVWDSVYIVCVNKRYIVCVNKGSEFVNWQAEYEDEDKDEWRSKRKRERWLVSNLLSCRGEGEKKRKTMAS